MDPKEIRKLIELLAQAYAEAGRPIETVHVTNEAGSLVEIPINEDLN